MLALQHVADPVGADRVHHALFVLVLDRPPLEEPGVLQILAPLERAVGKWIGEDVHVAGPAL
ncbi:MAG: hypothetical protein ACK559_24585, partial [bacterium]